MAYTPGPFWNLLPGSIDFEPTHQIFFRFDNGAHQIMLAGMKAIVKLTITPEESAANPWKYTHDSGHTIIHFQCPLRPEDQVCVEFRNLNGLEVAAHRLDPIS